MVTHDEERLGLVSFLDEVDCLVGNNIRHVSSLDMRTFRVDERRVEILSLTWYDVPIVETLRFMRFPFSQMPLPVHRRLVSSEASELLSNIGELTIELGVEGEDAVDMVVLPGKDSRSRGGTNWSSETSY
jgi:hypothetical protein